MRILKVKPVSDETVTLISEDLIVAIFSTNNEETKITHFSNEEEENDVVVKFNLEKIK